MEKYFVYILKSLMAKKTYVGFSENVQKRLQEHNCGKSSFTKIYKPWELVYTEVFDNKNAAINREKYFKSAAGRRRIMKILDNKKSYPGSSVDTCPTLSFKAGSKSYQRDYNYGKIFCIYIEKFDGKKNLCRFF